MTKIIVPDIWVVVVTTPGSIYHYGPFKSMVEGYDWLSTRKFLFSGATTHLTKLKMIKP